jgi:quinoprotein glucose dehydrogenase
MAAHHPFDTRAMKPRIPLLATGIVFVVLGLVLLAGGIKLLTLGGSPYYLAAGIAFCAIGVLLLFRRAAALWIAAALVVGTLGWAVWENGLDWWPLAARGGVIFVLAAWLLTPWATDRTAGNAKPWRHAWMGLSGALALAAVVGVIAMFIDVHDRTGTLPPLARGPGLEGGIPAADWRAYGRTNAGTRYSPLAELTPANVKNLKVAWTFRTGDLMRPGDPAETTYEVTPLKVGDTVYLCTPHDYVIALDAATGKERWRFDPKIQVSPNLQHLTCRGVSYHQAEQGAAFSDCPQRLFLATADARLMAIDAKTGHLCQSFGRGGAIDLWQGMPARQTGEYYSTAAPLVTKSLVIVGGETTDNYSSYEPSGVIRAFDVATGRLVWNFDADNPNDTAPIGPGRHYVHNSPNTWSAASADETLGLAYFPMGNETPDEWAGHRDPVGERFSSSILALDLATGKPRWVHQFVHHDLWDMDVGAQPSLVDLKTSQGVRPALIAATKQGDIYVLDRRTGEAIVPVGEEAVPQGAAPGDRTSPTQGFSALSFRPPPLREADMWGATMFDQLLCRIAFKSLRYEGAFTPPSLQGSLVYPGNFGVFDWGGIAVDPVRQVAFANPDYFAFISQLIPRAEIERMGRQPHGRGWHHLDRKVGMGEAADRDAKSQEGGANPMLGTPYAIDLQALRSPVGLPCQAPPWGYVAGVDINGAKIAWMHKNGTIRDNSPLPVPVKMGVPSLGGPIITAGGLAFMTSTLDYYLRAYDVTSGRQLGEWRLPAGAQSTPITYRADGRQFVITVAGGHNTLGADLGDYVIAYALPETGR